VALIAHNSAAWVVQDAIVQMHNTRSVVDIVDILAGVIFFGLPYAPFKDEWQPASWEAFSQALIHHLNRRDLDSKSSVKLDFLAIQTTMSEFQSRLSRLGQLLQIKTVSCSSIRVSCLDTIPGFVADHKRC
jgi:hypothetical protein